MGPTEQFAGSVTANIAYWQQRVRQLTDREFGALDVERRNLFRGVQFGLALPQARAATAELISQAFNFVERRGYWREWMPVLERAIQNCEDGDRLLQCKLLDQLGHLRRLDGQLSAALEVHRAAEIIALQVGDEGEVNHARFSLSEDYRCNRQYKKAEHYGLLALEGFTRLALTGGQVAATLNTLGLVAYARGLLELAEDRLARAVTQFRLVDQPTDLARTLKNLAIVLQSENKVEAALQCYAEAAALLEGTASELDRILIDLSLGTLYFNLGQFVEAEAAFRQANSPLLRQSGHTYYRAMTANNLGNVLLAQGRLEEAEAHLRGSLSLWRQTEDELMLANTLGTLGEALARQAQVAPAIQAYDEALDLLTRFPEDAWALQLHAKFSAQRRGVDDAD